MSSVSACARVKIKLTCSTRIGLAFALDLAAEHDIIHGVCVDHELLHRDGEDAPEARQIAEDRIRVPPLAGARVGRGCQVLLECHDVLRGHLRPVIVTKEIGKALEMGFPLLLRLRIIYPFFPRPFRDQRREAGFGVCVNDPPN